MPIPGPSSQATAGWRGCLGRYPRRFQGRRGRRDRGCFGGWDTATVPGGGLLDVLGEVVPQVPPVRDLDRLRCLWAACNGSRLIAPAGHHHRRGQPLSRSGSLSSVMIGSATALHSHAHTARNRAWSRNGCPSRSRRNSRWYRSAMDATRSGVANGRGTVTIVASTRMKASDRL
jgi:hypothetical protein